MNNWIEPFVLPFPAGMTNEEKSVNSWKNFRSCPKCGAEKGVCCRTPSCVQLRYAPPNLREKFPVETDQNEPNK